MAFHEVHQTACIEDQEMLFLHFRSAPKHSLWKLHWFLRFDGFSRLCLLELFVSCSRKIGSAIRRVRPKYQCNPSRHVIVLANSNVTLTATSKYHSNIQTSKHSSNVSYQIPMSHSQPQPMQPIPPCPMSHSQRYLILTESYVHYPARCSTYMLGV